MRGDEEEAMRPTAVKLESKKGSPEGSAEAEITAAVGRSDHRAAIGLCIQHYGGVLGRMCMSLLGSQSDAEDVVQETLVDAYRGLSGFRGDGTVRTWLLSIARRKCARLLERRSRQATQLRLVDSDSASTQADMEQQVLLRQRAERARQALEAVRPSEREALVLRYGAGLSFAEVAAAFDIEESAARKRVSRGIAAVRERLQKEGQVP